MILIVFIIVVAAICVFYFITAFVVGSKKDSDGNKFGGFKFIGYLMSGEAGSGAGCATWIGYMVFVLIICGILYMFIK